MPLFGTRDVTPLLNGAPTMERPSAEPLELPDVQILHLLFEMESGTVLGALPKALHPTIPPTMSVVLWRADDGPLGAFTLAQVRVNCRAGIFPRAFPTASYCGGERAAEALRPGWGFACSPATVRLDRGYDRITGKVELDGHVILDVELVDPSPIAGSDVQINANVNLARLPDGPRLVQVDPDYQIRRADRGRPVIRHLDEAAWRATGVVPTHPVAGIITTANLTLPAVRFTLDPDVPAVSGTRPV